MGGNANVFKVSVLMAATIATIVVLVGQFSALARAQDTGSDDASTSQNDPVYTIPELFADDALIGQTVVVTGAYVAWETQYLATDYELFQSNRPVNPYRYVTLEGSTPDVSLNRAILIVTGTLTSYTHDYAYLGVEQGLTINVTDAAQRAPPPPTELTDPPEPPDPLPGAMGAAAEANSQSPTLQQNGDGGGADCACQWAMITSGGINNANNHRRYRNDVEYKWFYKHEVAGYPADCIDVFYFDGDSTDLPSVDETRVTTASQSLIEERLRELGPAMEACRAAGIKPTLQFLVTDHGGGYQNQQQGTVAPGYGGGKIDTDADEGNDVSEGNFTIDASALSPGQRYEYDLSDDDNDQDPDTIALRTLGGNYEVWRCLNPPCTGTPPGGANWQQVNVDSTGGGMLEGIDLNNDGDTDDSYGIDETIYLLGDDTLTDDELTDALNPLCSSGVDLYVEMTQCFSGGFADDLARLRAAGCHVHFAAAASESELSWGWEDPANPENGYNFFEHYFIDELISVITGTNETITPTTWQRAYEHARDFNPDGAAAEPPAQRNDTNPVSDIDCLVMFGPYIREDDGRVCIRITNYCTETVEVNAGLNTYNWGIGNAPLNAADDTITLEPGETQELCTPPPEEPGEYCFSGRASIVQPRFELRTRWLNNVEIDVPADAATEPVSDTFEVGGSQMIEFPYIWLEADTSGLPPGWDYTLSQRVVELPFSSVPPEPTPVTVTLIPPQSAGLHASMLAQAEVTETVRLRVVGWGAFEDPGDAATRPAGAQYVSEVSLIVNILPQQPQEDGQTYLPLVVR
jgi:hypothetical protein